MTDKPQRTHYLGCWREHPECAQAAMFRLTERFRRGFDLDYYAGDHPEVNILMFADLQQVENVLSDEGLI